MSVDSFCLLREVRRTLYVIHEVIHVPVRLQLPPSAVDHVLQFIFIEIEILRLTLIGKREARDHEHDSGVIQIFQDGIRRIKGIASPVIKGEDEGFIRQFCPLFHKCLKLFKRDRMPPVALEGVHLIDECSERRVAGRGTLAVVQEHWDRACVIRRGGRWGRCICGDRPFRIFVEQPIIEIGACA